MPHLKWHKKVLVLLSLSLFSFILNAYTSIDHPAYDLRGRVEEKANTYLRNNSSFSEYSIPDRLKSEYYLKIDEIVATLSYQGYVSSFDIDRQVRDKIGSFVSRTLKNIVQTYNLETNVEKAINQMASDRGVYLSSMPGHTRSEYNRHKNNIIDKLRQTMYIDNRNYVRDYEIEQTIKHEMNYFFDTARHSSWNSWWGWDSNPAASSGWNSSNSSNWFSSLFGDFSSFFSLTEETLQNNPQEQKVIDIVYDIIGLSPDALPARIVSTLGDKIKTILNRVQNLGYTSDYDIKRIAREELRPILDSISFKGEICSICLDDFSPGQRVGTLSCNDKHFFHVECIYKWLETSKTCPLCRASGVIVSKQHSVPY
ncbi:MAG: RING-H2 finger protein [bacterium]